jgi:hypothetical protein
MMSRERKKQAAAALQEKLKILRSITHSHAVIFFFFFFSLSLLINLRSMFLLFFQFFRSAALQNSER